MMNERGAGVEGGAEAVKPSKCENEDNLMQNLTLHSYYIKK